MKRMSLELGNLSPERSGEPDSGLMANASRGLVRNFDGTLLLVGTIHTHKKMAEEILKWKEAISTVNVRFVDIERCRAVDACSQIAMRCGTSRRKMLPCRVTLSPLLCHVEGNTNSPLEQLWDKSPMLTSTQSIK